MGVVLMVLGTAFVLIVGSITVYTVARQKSWTDFRIVLIRELAQTAGEERILAESDAGAYIIHEKNTMFLGSYLTGEGFLLMPVCGDAVGRISLAFPDGAAAELTGRSDGGVRISFREPEGAHWQFDLGSHIQWELLENLLSQGGNYRNELISAPGAG